MIRRAIMGHLRLLIQSLPLLMLVALAGCNRADATAQANGSAAAAAIPITVSATKVVELQRSVRIVGSLAGLETATLSNRITGVISHIYVDRGDRVKPNQTLL